MHKKTQCAKSQQNCAKIACKPKKLQSMGNKLHGRRHHRHYLCITLSFVELVNLVSFYRKQTNIFFQSAPVGKPCPTKSPIV